MNLPELTCCHHFRKLVHSLELLEGSLNADIHCHVMSAVNLGRASIEREPSDSLVHNMFPDEPKTCTVKSFPGHSFLSILPSLSTNCFRRSSLSEVGNNRSYSSRISPLSLSSSSGFNEAFGSSFAFSNGASPMSYNILLLPKAAAVSYLHVGRPRGREPMDPFASDLTERGE